MTNTIQVEIYDSTNKSQLALQDRGIVISEISKDKIFVELRELPAILWDVEQTGYLTQDDQQMKDEAMLVGSPDHLLKPPSNVWTLHQINGHGITLYLLTMLSKDRVFLRDYQSFIFIPFNNILSIHTVDQEFLDSSRRATMLSLNNTKN